MRGEWAVRPRVRVVLPEFRKLHKYFERREKDDLAWPQHFSKRNTRRRNYCTGCKYVTTTKTLEEALFGLVARSQEFIFRVQGGFILPSKQKHFVNERNNFKLSLVSKYHNCFSSLPMLPINVTMEIQEEEPLGILCHSQKSCHRLSSLW